jgi:glycosyltransferase involved in cell wall biosynthesis
MASGVPCIATDVGDSAAIIGGNGAVVPPRDPGALAAALGGLAGLGREARRAMGAAARARIVRNYGIDRIAARYAALYESVLEAHGLQSMVRDGRATAAAATRKVAAA